MAPVQTSSWRERLADLLPDWPVLRTLLLNPLFGMTILVMGGGLLLVLVALPKVWRTTEAGFRPVIRVSLLDFGQAWSLRRAADKQQALGNQVQELQARFSAAGNNLGNRELAREALRAFLRNIAAQTQYASRAASTAAWLLRLSPTNNADVYLAARIYESGGYTGQVLALLESRQEELPEDLRGPLAKALFDSGRPDEFGKWWVNVGSTLEDDPELALYFAAWQVGWGPVAERQASMDLLLAATEALDQRLLANQLLLIVYENQGDIDRYRATLDRLVQFRGERLIDHVRLWFLLDSANQTAQARELALGHPFPPRTPMEATLLAQALIVLKSPDEARSLLERYGDTLGNLPAMFTMPYWTLLGDLYVQSKQWEELRQMGRKLQGLSGAQGSLAGFGHFLEGRGWDKVGAHAAARESFTKALGEGFALPEYTLEVSIELIRLDFPDLAQAALLPLEPQMASSVRYWQAVYEAAYAQHADEALLFKAARRALDLEPENPVRQVNYAVALLVSRNRPEEAARMTFSFSQANPQSPLARLNHAHALVQTGRHAEATQLLRTLSAEENPIVKSSVGLAELEIAIALKDLPAARAARGKIDPQHLFPTQRAWLRQVADPVLAAKP